jgi:hypothetical protein
VTTRSRSKSPSMSRMSSQAFPWSASSLSFAERSSNHVVLQLNLKNDTLRRRFDSLKYDIKKVEEGMCADSFKNRRRLMELQLSMTCRSASSGLARNLGRKWFRQLPKRKRMRSCTRGARCRRKASSAASVSAALGSVEIETVLMSMCGQRTSASTTATSLVAAASEA